MQPEPGVQLGGDAVPVAQLVFQGRRLDLDVVKADGRVDDDGPLGGGLAHDLLARLALLGHEDHQVAVHLARAGQPAPGERRVLVPVMRLAAVGRRQVIGGRRDAVLRERALLDGDLALAARLAAAADGFDFDAQRAGGVQEVRACGHLALPSRRLKDDAIGCFWHDDSKMMNDTRESDNSHDSTTDASANAERPREVRTDLAQPSACKSTAS